MADAKLTALTAETSPTTDDLLYLVDDPAGTPASKKITLADLFGATSKELPLASDCFIYIGDSGTNGSWRIGLDTGNLTFQKRVGGSWVEKGQMS